MDKKKRIWFSPIIKIRNAFLIKYNSYATLYGKGAHMELKVYIIFLYSSVYFSKRDNYFQKLEHMKAFSF